MAPEPQGRTAMVWAKISTAGPLNYFEIIVFLISHSWNVVKDIVYLIFENSLQRSVQKVF
jgi:hypothetical protein